MKIVLASGNKGKLKEFSHLLSPYDLEVFPQSDFNVIPPEETGLSFVENAIIKARYASKISGLPAIADDSGIAIDALNGQPGIYSARYSALYSEMETGAATTDQKNIDLVLENMKGLPEAERTARFHCVLVYMSHAEDPTPIVCHGQWEGRITETQTGEGGFGYDPIFWISKLDCTAAQLSKEQKSGISHRGKALKQLIDKIDLIKA